MGVLQQGRGVGATGGSNGGEGGGRGRRWLGEEESLDWVELKFLLLLMVMMMMMELLLLMMMRVNMVVVMLQWHPVVAEPVLGGLGHGLKHPHDPSLPLHELLDGRAVLLLFLLPLLLLLMMRGGGTWQQARDNISAIFPEYSPQHSVWKPSVTSL